MGNYADLDDVRAYLQDFTIATSSNPSESEVTDFITQVEGEINGVLSAQGYASVPATGTNDVALLQGYVARYVAALAWVVAYDRDDAPTKVKMWRDAYRDFLARLRRGEQHLIDQVPQGDDTPVFGVVRHPTRDDYFTERYDTTDWDE